jgi:formamidopyrimidine-DNA glycosylase
MPELPEVESTRRSLLPHVMGRAIRAIEVRQPSLRRQVDVGALDTRVKQRRIVGLRRRSKYLLFDLAEPQAGTQAHVTTVMAVHLGMTGGLTVVPATTVRRTHDHVSFELDNGRILRFNDARRFGSIDIFAADKELGERLFAQLGAEPFDEQAFVAERLWQAAHRTTKNLKQFLLDGRFVVGVGNIYASEALWRAELSPRLPGHRLTKRQAKRLVPAVIETLTDAITFGGTTLRDFGDADGKAGGYGTRLRVYGRADKPCRRCDTPIRKITQNQRSTYFCGQCQRR